MNTVQEEGGGTGQGVAATDLDPVQVGPGSQQRGISGVRGSRERLVAECHHRPHTTQNVILPLSSYLEYQACRAGPSLTNAKERKEEERNENRRREKKQEKKM